MNEADKISANIRVTDWNGHEWRLSLERLGEALNMTLPTLQIRLFAYLKGLELAEKDKKDDRD